MRALLIVLAASPAAATASRVTVPHVPSLQAMTRAAALDRAPLAPRCFAHAADHSFACLGHDAIYNKNQVGAHDRATNVRIDVVGPRAQTSWTIAALGKRPTTRSATVQSALAKLGMRPLTTTAVQLTVNAATRLGGHVLRLDVRTHEGDASFQNVGKLALGCPGGDDEVTFDLRDAGLVLGETAWAFPSPDGTFVAVSIVGVTGGEGTLTFSLDTAVIDLETSCSQRVATMWTSQSR